MRYRAFISYNHRDRKIAHKLLTSLEKYRLPKHINAENSNRKLGRFFKDEDELAGSAGLGAALDGAIDDSENMIVIASPDSAKSKWVNREVTRFKLRNKKPVFAFVVREGPNKNNVEGECFAPALRFELNKDGTTSDKEADPPLAPNIVTDGYKKAFIRLVAGIIDIPFDSLWQREQRRRRLFLMKIGLGLLLLVFATAIYYSFTPKYAVRYTDLRQSEVKEIFLPGESFPDEIAFLVSTEGGKFWSDTAGHEVTDKTVFIHAIDDKGKISGAIERHYLDAYDHYEIPEKNGTLEKLSEQKVMLLLNQFGYVNEDEMFPEIEKDNIKSWTISDATEAYLDGTGADFLIHEFDSLKAIQIIGNDHTPPSTAYYTIDSGLNWNKSSQFRFHLKNVDLVTEGLPSGTLIIGTPEEIDPYYPSHGGLFVSVDYGITWKELSPPVNDWNALVQVVGSPSKEGYFAVELEYDSRDIDPQGAGLWLTRNNGVTWEEIGYQGTENNVSELIITNESHVVGIINGTLVRYAERAILDRLFQRYDLKTKGNVTQGEN